MSLTIKGLALAVVLPVLVSIGFSEACANELVLVGSALPGIITAYLGRVRQGDVDLLGRYV